MNIKSRAEIYINLDNLNSNINEYKKIINKNTKIIAVVKTDAYGHGAVCISKELEENDDIYGYGVACVKEGIQLRKNGIKKPIIVLGTTFDEEISDSIDYNLTINIHCLDLAKKLSNEAVKKNKDAFAHIKVDTGMSRLGFLYSEKSIKDIKDITSLPRINITGIFSHLARADEDDSSHTYNQINLFNSFINDLEKENICFKYKHLSNSAGAINFSNLEYNLVRIGIGMYGINPTNSQINLKPLLELKSKIAFIKEVPKNTQVSYGGIFVSEKPMKIATIPIGYGDGLPRSYSNSGYVLVKGKKAKIIGRICMDHIMIDVTDIKDIKLDDTITLIGKDNENEITVFDIEKMSGRFYYEIFCLLNKRLPRIYIKNNEVIYKSDYYS